MLYLSLRKVFHEIICKEIEMKVLVTGFEPFGGEKVNPALEAVKGLPAEIHGAEVRWLEVPTVFHKSAQVLEEEMSRYQPDFVLCIGQAGGRTSLTPERVAINQDDARIPDNEGNQPIDLPIRPDGAPAYFSSLPIKSDGSSYKKRGITGLCFQYGRDFCLQSFDVSGPLFGRKKIHS